MATDATSPARLTIWSQVKALAGSPMAPYYFIAASVSEGKHAAGATKPKGEVRKVAA